MFLEILAAICLSAAFTIVACIVAFTCLSLRKERQLAANASKSTQLRKLRDAIMDLKNRLNDTAAIGAVEAAMGASVSTWLDQAVQACEKLMRDADQYCNSRRDANVLYVMLDCDTVVPELPTKAAIAKHIRDNFGGHGNVCDAYVDRLFP